MKSELTFYAQTMPGVEEIAWLEIRARLTGAKFGSYLYAKEQNGIVTFGYKGRFEDLLRLRTTEDVFLQVVSVPKMPRGRRALYEIGNLVQHGDVFGWAVNHFLRQRKFSGPPTYRVISRQYGQHDFRRKDFQRVVLRGLKQRYPRWQTVEDNSQVEFWVNLLGSHLLIGLRLSDREMRHRHRKKVALPAALRPSVAAAMVFLTQPAPTDCFLDPMCGSGTILLERRQMGPYGQLWGGDIVHKYVKATRRNLFPGRRQRRPKPIYFYGGNGRFLPFPTQTIDKVAVNLPFGKQIGSKAEIKQLYPAFLAELDRVLTDEGRVVLLSSEFDLVKEALRPTRLQIVTGYSIAILGQWGRIYIIEKQ